MKDETKTKRKRGFGQAQKTRLVPHAERGKEFSKERDEGRGEVYSKKSF